MQSLKQNAKLSQYFSAFYHHFVAVFIFAFYLRNRQLALALAIKLKTR